MSIVAWFAIEKNQEESKCPSIGKSRKIKSRYSNDEICKIAHLFSKDKRLQIEFKITVEWKKANGRTIYTLYL